MSNFFSKSVGGNVGIRLSFLEIIAAMIAVLNRLKFRSKPPIYSTDLYKTIAPKIFYWEIVEKISLRFRKYTFTIVKKYFTLGPLLSIYILVDSRSNINTN